MISTLVKLPAGLLVLVAMLGGAGGNARAGVAEAERLADRLMEYRLPDGGVLVNKPGTAEGRLVPYFANLAALGWVETAKVTSDTEKQKRYLKAARLWIDWYASHQNPNGTIYDFEGPPSSLVATGRYDSTDSYAATYALLLWRYFEATQDVDYLRGKGSSLDGAYEAVLLTMDGTGLTYAHPNYPNRFLMDNCEVAAGFVAFEKIYRVLDQPQKASEAREHLVKLKDQFSRFYRPSVGAFAYALDPFGVPLGTFSKGYPDAMANLFAITFLAPAEERTAELVNRVKDKFWLQADAQDFPQWWTWAAMTAGDEVLKTAAMEKLQAQAEAADAHSFLVGMAAATHVSGVSSIRFPEVVCNWEQLTALQKQPSQRPEHGDLVVPRSSIVLTGHKVSATLGGNRWLASDVSLPAAIDYSITTSSGYLQVNLVWPQPLDLTSGSKLNVTYEGLKTKQETQLQVTLVEDDGDWWAAEVPSSRPEAGTLKLSMGDLKSSRPGKARDRKMDLSRMQGIRFQVSNKTAATSGTFTISQLRLED